MFRHNPAVLNYRKLHQFHVSIDNFKVLSVYMYLYMYFGGLKDWSSIGFIMLTVLPFECNETAPLGSWGGVLVGHLFLVLYKTNRHAQTRAASENMKKVRGRRA